jgi:methyl-accepting chemotaxis protein
LNSIKNEEEKQMSLKKKMLLALLTPTFIILICLGFYSYTTARKAIRTNIEAASTYATAYYAERMQSSLARKELLAEELAANFGARDMHEWRREEIVKLLDIRDQVGIPNVCVGFENGEFYSLDGWIPPPDYDPRVRNWYIRGREAASIHYTEVYQDAITKQLVASICKRIIGPDGQVQEIGRASCRERVSVRV